MVIKDKVDGLRSAKQFKTRKFPQRGTFPSTTRKKPLVSSGRMIVSILSNTRVSGSVEQKLPRLKRNRTGHNQREGFLT